MENSRVFIQQSHNSGVVIDRSNLKNSPFGYPGESNDNRRYPKILYRLLRYPLQQSLQTCSIAKGYRHELKAKVIFNHPPYRRSFNNNRRFLPR